MFAWNEREAAPVSARGGSGAGGGALGRDRGYRGEPRRRLPQKFAQNVHKFCTVLQLLVLGGIEADF